MKYRRSRWESGTVEIITLRNVLFPELDPNETREKKIKEIKRMIQENHYISDEKLDSALAKLIDEVDRE